MYVQVCGVYLMKKRDLRLFRVVLLFNIFSQNGADVQEGLRIPQNLVCLV